MSARPTCNCAVCELEHVLLDELKNKHTQSTYRAFALQSPVLSALPTCDELLLHLRESYAAESHPSTADEIVGELLRISCTPQGELGRHILLLVLMPAIHRTSTQIASGFPSLTRDDIAQHLVTSVWEILYSQSLQTQKSHFAFTIIRAMRRSAFRWASHEANFNSGAKIEGASLKELPADAGDNFEAKIVLREFLTRCLSCGVLSRSEHELLVLFKIQGLSSETLAARQKLSDVAVRHRVQRVVEKLRRAARAPMSREQRDDAVA